MTNPIPIGDVQLYDEYRASLEHGPWRVEVGHTVAGVPTGTIGATQEFVVGAPQFAIDPALVVSQYPPAGGTGDYSAVLPHIVLTDPLLPWERAVGTAPRQPWLALLVLRDTELLGGAESPTRTLTGTVERFRSAEPGVVKPLPDVGLDVSPTDPVSYVRLATATFTALAPRLADLRFLAHCRQANVADKADQGLDPDGVFSVVVANRFPVVTGGEPVRYVAHLVSMEGLADLLVDEPDFAGSTSIALVSLASWAFTTVPTRRQDFGALIDALVGMEYDGTTTHPDRLALRLPARPIDTTTTAGAEADRRLADGFVPLGYHLRTGEDTFAWYRGPLAPVRTTPLAAPAPFPSADAALAYTPFGVLDASLATAWQAGRSLALADRAFGQALFAFRRRSNSKVDLLLQQVHSTAFSARTFGETHLAADAHTEFLGMLDTDLLTGIGRPAAPGTTATRAAAARLRAAPPHALTAIRAVLTDPESRQRIADLVAEDVRPLADWLARLLLLYPVPSNLLVPDERMLPPEAVRFCYVDQNWQRALFDGAVSVGLESSRDVLFHEATYDLLYSAAQQAARGIREQRTSVAGPGATADTISGFLLRSAVVSGWPNLAVRATGQDGAPLGLARMDHLAANVLLCLFWGVPTTVELSEPQEGLRFGVQDGSVFLRQPVASAGRPLGAQLSRTVRVWPNDQRAGGNGVLDVAAGVVRRVQDALAGAGVPVSDFGPADLGLQLTAAPEAVMFTQAG